MDLSGYIRELLEDHDFVILPGAGAFMASYRPAQPDETGKMLLPPSRELYFNPELKMNDGLLPGYVMRQAEVTLREARKMVSEYVDDLLYHLDRDGQVTLEHLGTLTKREEEIAFTPLGALRQLPAAYGLIPVAMDAATPGEVTHKSGTSAAEEHEGLVAKKPDEPVHAKPESPAPEKPDEPAPEKPDEPAPGKPDEPAPEKPDGPAPGKPDESAPGKPDESVHAVPESPAPEKPGKSAPGRNRRRALRVILPAVGLMLGALLIWVLVVREHPVADRTPQSREQQKAAAAPAHPAGEGDISAQADMTTKDTLRGEMAPAVSALPAAQTGTTMAEAPDRPYYLVAGSFRSQKNAGEFMEKLTREGFRPVSLGQVGSYWFVATDSFRTEREAVRAVNSFINTHPGSEAWIYKPRN
ncbi:MAG TPA: SPOR domain-containing protein [Prolixibacteraceae bacterium]|nr:SPOR domain-containing protein [Prolixibacteraceae bacterium]